MSIAAARSDLQIAQDVNAARNYLTMNFKKVDKLGGVKREALLKKLSEQVAILQKHDAEIKISTREELVKLGLIVEKE